MLAFLDDARFAFRQMRRRAGPTLAGLAALVLGIGAATAVFTVVQAVLLRPLPYSDAHRLVTAWQTFPHWRNNPALSAQWDRIAFSYSDYVRLAAGTAAFEGIGAAYFRTAQATDQSGPVVEIPVARGSVSLAGLLGVRLQLGRWFLPGEEGPTAPHLVVLPDAMWRSRYGRDPDIVGRTLELNGEPFEIIGVLARDFQFGSVGPFARDGNLGAVWVPIGSGRGDLTENSQIYEVIARLRAGVTFARAEDETRRIVQAGRDPAKRDARLLARLDAETGAARAPLWILFAAALLLLVVTCANLAAMQLGEAATRMTEMRTRLALGARPGRLVRQLLTESVTLTTIGSLAAIPVSALLVRALLALAPERLPREAAIATGWSALGFAGAAALVTGILCGLAPARLFARRSTAAASSSDRAVTGRRTRSQQWFIGVEAALSTILLVAAGLLLRSLLAEQRVPPGFTTSRLLTVAVAQPSGRGGASRITVQNSAQFVEPIIAALRELPGVDWVTATSNLPLAGGDGQWAVSVDPAIPLSNSSPSAQHDAVWPGYFAAMEIPLLQGRALSDSDLPDRPRVAVVNRTMARTLWPGESVIGKRFLAPNGGVREIVGVVEDTKHRGLGREPRATFYESLRQIDAARVGFLVRTRSAPARLAAAARAAVLGVDPATLVERVSTMDDAVSDSMKTERFRALLLQFFALAALAVTAIGLAGVAMHAATVRMRELCVRMAIGATPGDVRRLVLGQYAGFLAAGAALGAGAALATMRWASPYFFGLAWYDPPTYAGAGAILLCVSAGAGWLALGRLRHANISTELGMH